MSSTESKQQENIFPLSECRRFIKECLEAVGTPSYYAEMHADLLVEADYRGHFSHGINRLEWYINDIKTKACNPCAKPKILKENLATAWVDGCNGLGSVVGNFCMEVAMKKAKEVGVGWVICKGSNHFGITGMYSSQAMKEGLLGMAFTNSSPAVVPTRAKDAAVGTCPIAVAAPGKNDSFELDMATCTVALGKIEMQIRKNEPIPNGWALDEHSNPTTDSVAAFKALRLLPLGGAEETSGYKGYGLGVMVEILTGILAGATFGPFVREWQNVSEEHPSNLSHCFVAIDPDNFAPGFTDRLQEYMNYLRSLEPVDESKPVLVAGDKEKNHMEFVDKVGGIQYVQNQLDSCIQTAKLLNVKPLQPVVKIY